MKHLIKILLLIALGTGISSLASANSALPMPVSSVQTLDQIVAVVNNDVITETELNNAINNAKKQMENAHQPMPSAAVLHDGVLQQLIYHKIQLQLAKRAGITVSNGQVNMAIKSIAKNNKTNLADLKEKLAKDNISFADFKKNIKEQLVINQVQRQAISGTVKVSDAEVNQFLQKYNAQPGNATTYNVLDILVDIPNNASKAQLAKAKQTAQKIATQLKKGTALTAIKEGQQTDLGWLPLSQLPNIFADAITKMKTNGVAGPLQAANGFHVIKLKGAHRSTHAQPTRMQVRNILFQKKFQTALVKWLENMRKTAYVKIN